MRNKYAQDIAVVIFAYYWSLSLVNRLVAIVTYSIFSHNPITLAVVLAVAFGLSYSSIWLFFNKWKVDFWMKVCITIGIIIVSYIVGVQIDMAAAYNMTHPR